MTCPACAGAPCVRGLEKEGWTIRVCASCGHGWISPIPSEADLKALYTQNENAHLENGHALELEALLGDDPATSLHYFADRLRYLERFVPGLRTKRVLDFGCSSGLFVQALRHAGVSKAEGIDIIPDMIEHGRSRGLPLEYDENSTFLPQRPQGFDVICANTVLEHVRHPAEMLASFRSALAEGGILCVAVPNFDSLQIKVMRERSPIVDPPHHVHYFTSPSLRRQLESAGFEVMLLESAFWGRETDIYFVAKGVPGWAAALTRRLVSPLRFALNRAEMGGVIHAVCRKVP
jgi:2-polyprenyl-3-methyl-5-hydroxy-6-metoxy-1,4-benzoquinol methylase